MGGSYWSALSAAEGNTRLQQTPSGPAHVHGNCFEKKDPQKLASLLWKMVQLTTTATRPLWLITTRILKELLQPRYLLCNTTYIFIYFMKKVYQTLKKVHELEKFIVSEKCSSNLIRKVHLLEKNHRFWKKFTQCERSSSILGKKFIRREIISSNLKNSSNWKSSSNLGKKFTKFEKSSSILKKSSVKL